MAEHLSNVLRGLRSAGQSDRKVEHETAEREELRHHLNFARSNPATAPQKGPSSFEESEAIRYCRDRRSGRAIERGASPRLNASTRMPLAIKPGNINSGKRYSQRPHTYTVVHRDELALAKNYPIALLIIRNASLYFRPPDKTGDLSLITVTGLIIRSSESKYGGRYKRLTML